MSSNNKTLKVALAIVTITLVAYLATANFLGPGVGDFSDPLLNGYSYSDVGHHEKTIVYSNSRGESQIVIDARVDEWRIENDSLYVARRPREIYQEDNVTKSRLSLECEYFVVTTISHSVTKIDESNGVSCK